MTDEEKNDIWKWGDVRDHLKNVEPDTEVVVTAIQLLDYLDRRESFYDDMAKNSFIEGQSDMRQRAALACNADMARGRAQRSEESGHIIWTFLDREAGVREECERIIRNLTLFDK